MALLDVFVMKFVTQGLDDVTSDVKALERQLNKLEATEEDAEECAEDLANQMNNVTDEVEDAAKSFEKMDKVMNNAQNTSKSLDKAMNKIFGQAGLAGFLTQALKTFSPYILAFNAVKNTFGEINKLSEGLDEYNKKLQLSAKYKVFTREDARNAKEYEMIMRDVRMGMGTISANLTKAFLPTLTKLAFVARNVTDYLLEHMPAIKIALAVVGLSLLPSILKGLGKIFGLIGGKAVLLTGLILLLEDLYVWMNDGETAFGDFWNRLFGSPAQLLETLEAIPNWLKVIGLGLVSLALIDPWKTLVIGSKGVGLVLQGVIGLLKFIPGVLSLISVGVRTLTAFMMANPILAAISAILAVIVLVWQNWDKITAAVKKATEAVKNFFKAKGNANDVQVDGVETNAPQPDGSHADGLDYVPFDGYIAKLHKGERVQTASEANDWRNGLMAAKRAINFTASYPLNAIPRGAVSQMYNNSSTSSNKTVTFTGDVVINTQATDGEGVVKAFQSFVKQAVISLDDGMLA